jgi:hypothetical protein
MTPAEILAQAAQRSVEVGLNPAGDGLRLWADGDPPTDLVELLKSAKPELIAHLHRRAYDGPLLQSVEAARPRDVDDVHWQTALRGLRAFLAAGHGDEAERLGWPRDELFAIPPVWSRVDLCGVGLLIGDCEVTEVTPTRIGIRTASGAPQAFYRRPQPNYAVAYKAHLALNRHETEAGNQEARLRAIERVVGLYRQHHPNCTIDEAKVAVLQALAQLKENN